MVSCDTARKDFSDYLRLKRINSFLENKNSDYIKAYKNMAFFTKDNDSFYLTYYWLDEVKQDAYKKSPCEKLDTQNINIKGQAFDRFHKIIDYAVKHNFNAFRFQDNRKDLEAKVRYYICKPFK